METMTTDSKQIDIQQMQETQTKLWCELTNLMSYLASDKFQGMENNFVNAREMFDAVKEIRNLIP